MIGGPGVGRAARLEGKLRALFPLYLLLLRLATRHPNGFGEKVQYKIARDRRPLLKVFADKLESKEYVRRRLGPGFTPEVLAVADRAGDLPWAELPDEVAFKVSHGSGGGVISSAGQDPEARVPEATIENAWGNSAGVHPTNADPERVGAFLDMHLSLDFFWMFAEWGYREVRRRALAEEIIEGPGGGDPLEYRLYTFSGRCALIIAGTSLIHPNPPLDIFLPDWTRLDATRPGTQPHDSVPERPPFLGEMIDAAEVLGAGTDFLRVDVLASEERFWIGELTSYPYAGRLPFEPPEIERWAGELWDHPADYSTLPQGSYPLPPLDSST